MICKCKNSIFFSTLMRALQQAGVLVMLSIYFLVGSISPKIFICLLGMFVCVYVHIDKIIIQSRGFCILCSPWVYSSCWLHFFCFGGFFCSSLLGLEADDTTAQGAGAVRGFLLQGPGWDGWMLSFSLLPFHRDNRLLVLLLWGQDGRRGFTSQRHQGLSKTCPK